MPELFKAHGAQKWGVMHEAPKPTCEEVKPRSSAAQGYGYRWQKTRRIFLHRNPLCVECRRLGYYVPATEVDHIKPHKGDKKLFWDEKNWQGLCESHHSAKTARENRGFGNPERPLNETHAAA